MESFRRLLRRLSRRNRTDELIVREIDDELSFHLEMRTRENIDAGMSPEEARRSAAERLGRLERVRRQGRVIRKGSRGGLVARLVGDLRRDARFAARAMVRAPGYTAVAVLALTLGIGVNTAVFSVVDGILLQELPYADPDRLVTAAGIAVRPETREALTELGSLAQSAFFTIDAPEMVTPEGAARGRALLVGEGFFATLGVGAARGRTLVASDYQSDAPPVAVITDRMWRQRFAANDEVVGSTVLLDGVAHEIVGILPRGVTLLVYENRDIFVPLVAFPRGLMMLGRLRDDFTFEQGRDQALALADTLALQDEASELSRLADAGSDAPTIYYRSLYEQVVGAERDGLLLLTGAVMLVLLIAAANVANLSLARALTRRQEIAVRTALGAGRGRLVRQLLTESSLLAAVGGLLGLTLATWGVPILLAMAPTYMARADNVSVDFRALVFTIAVSLAVGALAGLVPVLFAGRPRFGTAVRTSPAAAGVSRGGRRALTVLVVAEVAVALMVLVATGLFVRAFLHIRPSAPGFEPQAKLVFQVRLAEARYPDAPSRAHAYEQILAGLRTLPNAIDAAAITAPPLVGNVWPITAAPEGRDAGDGELPTVWLEHASANYHDLMEIAIRRGRALRSPPEGEAEMVVSETAARALFPEGDALGKRIRLMLPEGFLGDAVADRMLRDGYRVVGVAADTLRLGNSRRPRPTVWVDFSSGGVSFTSFVLQTRGPPRDLAASVRELIAELDAQMPVEDLRTMEDIVHDSAALPRFYMLLMCLFGGIAILLALIGFYGVMAFSVARRAHELGLRVALGASPRGLRRMVLRRGAGIIGTGLVIGLAGSIAVTRLLESFLYGLNPTDLLTYVTLTALLALVGMIACYVPARRATRVDPMIALRQR